MNAKKTGELIAQLRRSKNMSQSNLAERLGITNKAISRWETGRGYPDIEILPELSRALDVSIQELLDGQIMRLSDISATELHSMEFVCTYAGQQRKRQAKKIILFSCLFFPCCVRCAFIS